MKTIAEVTAPMVKHLMLAWMTGGASIIPDVNYRLLVVVVVFSGTGIYLSLGESRLRGADQ